MMAPLAIELVTHAGFYGKLPIMGDFVSRRLPGAFIKPWDTWLQAAMAASREQLAERWLEIYLTSPIWRFALRQGVLDDGSWVGLVLPSIDRVGRYFPLTLAIPVYPSLNLVTVVRDSQTGQVLNAAETIALAALEEDPALDIFDARVLALSLDLTVTASCKPLIQEGYLGFDMPSVSAIGQACDAWLAQELEAQFGGSHSLWWSDGGAHLAPRLLAFSGLPPPEAFAGMLGG